MIYMILNWVQTFWIINSTINMSGFCNDIRMTYANPNEINANNSGFISKSPTAMYFSNVMLYLHRMVDVVIIIRFTSNILARQRVGNYVLMTECGSVGKNSPTFLSGCF